MHSGLRLALLKPVALLVTPPSDPPLSLLLLRCILCLVFVILFRLFIAWQCSLVASWCTLCVGMSLSLVGIFLRSKCLPLPSMGITNTPSGRQPDNWLAHTNKKQRHEDPDEHDVSQSRQINGNANKLNDRKIGTSAPEPDDVNFPSQQHGPGHHIARHTLYDSEVWDIRCQLEDCYIKNACKKRPYSAGTPP